MGFFISGFKVLFKFNWELFKNEGILGVFRYIYWIKVFGGWLFSVSDVDGMGLIFLFDFNYEWDGNLLE